MNTTKQLRPGRHQLSRDEVKDHQRERIFRALESVMSAQGYLDTSVADLIRSAGVSRQTFYELFASKQDCFLSSYRRRQGSVLDVIRQTPETENPMDRFAAFLKTYLVVMATDPGLSRLYLIGVYTAGPEAIAKRIDMQQQFVEGIAMVLEVQSKQDRFRCQALVATISTLVTNALLEEDPSQAVLELHQPLVGIAKQLLAVD
ncbi:MAG: TetR/AcrR family transcriptional regulator [Mycobacterium sp.]